VLATSESSLTSSGSFGQAVAEYLQSNIALLSSMIEMGYEDKKTIARRIQAMQKWLDAPELLTADSNCEYAATIKINLDEIKEPILACPNDPDDVKLLSEVANTKIDEVFIGSCACNGFFVLIAHFYHRGQ
jgi:aconitate hydratase 2/2-methylisocitrate dehydratase